MGFLHKPSTLVSSQRILASAKSNLSDRLVSAPRNFRRTLSKGMIGLGESGTRYRLVSPLGKRVRGTSATANVWRAVDSSNEQIEYVAKGPAGSDSASQNWPAFHHELKMQRLFVGDRMIRSIVDFIPPSSEISEPMMILEPFQKTLWDARNTRPFTTSELKWVMKMCLGGLVAVHRKGLVYTDLKMENIGITGFDNEKPNKDALQISVKLADCGSISKPGTREISAPTYRSPEVHFGKKWDQSTDIWSWGIILAQLLLAQVDFESPGMYDAIATGDLDNKTKLARDTIAIDFSLHSVPLFSDDEATRRMLPPPNPEESYIWASRMMDKGISGEGIQFLVDVLNPRPDARLTAAEILDSGYLEL